MTYTPAADIDGTDTIAYQISDGNGGTDTALVAVTVDPVNDPPTTAGSAGVEVFENAGGPVLDLFDAFEDDLTPDADLVFVAETDVPSLVTGLAIDPTLGRLTQRTADIMPPALVSVATCGLPNPEDHRRLQPAT